MITALWDNLKMKNSMYFDAIKHPIVNDEWQGMYMYILTKGWIYGLGLLILFQKRMGIVALGLLIAWGYFARNIIDRDYGFKTGIGIFLGFFILGGIIYVI